MYNARFHDWQMTINKLFSQPTGIFTPLDIVVLVQRQKYIDYIRKNHSYLIDENGQSALLENKPVYFNGNTVPPSFFEVIYDNIQGHIDRKAIQPLLYLADILNFYHHSAYRSSSNISSLKALINFVHHSYPAHQYIVSAKNDNTNLVFIQKDYLLMSKYQEGHYHISAIHLGSLIKDFILLKDLTDGELPSIVTFKESVGMRSHSQMTKSERIPFHHLRIQDTSMSNHKFKFGDRSELLTNKMWNILVSQKYQWKNLPYNV